MPLCPYGAEPKPGFQGIVRWMEDADWPPEVIAIVEVLRDLGDPYTTMQLWDIDELCASNPAVPEAITLEDVVKWTALVPLAGAAQDPVFIHKMLAWARYNVALQNCQCKLPPLTPGNNCTAAPPSFVTGDFGSISGPFPVTIDQVVMDAILEFENGDWTWFRRGSATVDSGAHSGNGLDIEVQLVDGSWLVVDDIETLNLDGGTCQSVAMQASVPRFDATTSVRIVNRVGGAHTITNFNYCFCAPAPTVTPLPPQPPVALPSPPAFQCGTDTLCALVQDLARRLTNIAAQVSDIQAVIGGADQLTELSRMTMTQEGEANLVLGTRAVSVELTALGDEAYTSALGRPRGLMRVGSVRWGDGLGYSPRRFIDADRFDDTRPTGATSISWQLLPGTQGILKFLG